MTSRWTRRVLDLRQIILQAESTYFDPDLFRLNINNAIQTARTVTWLMQKEKNSFSGLEEWYIDNIQNPLKADGIMRWLVDARNTIEKQGDLSVNSFWRAYHIWNYFETGPELRASSRDNLFSNLRGLWKLFKAEIPSQFTADSVIVVDRKWFANSLPDVELIDAVAYAYEILRKMSLALDEFTKQASPQEANAPIALFSTSQARRSFIKYSDGKEYEIGSFARASDLSSEYQEKLKNLIKSSGGADFFPNPVRSVEDNVRKLGDFATRLFEADGYHISICMLFSGDRLTHLIQHEPADHTEKYIYWHELGYCVKLWNITEIYFIAEAWQRQYVDKNTPVSQLPIVGETLHVDGIRKDGNFFHASYEVTRLSDSVKIKGPAHETTDLSNIFVPTMKAWGYAWEDIKTRLPESERINC